MPLNKACTKLGDINALLSRLCGLKLVLAKECYRVPPRAGDEVVPQLRLVLELKN